ncbi:unnamed protein product, partial [Meganyctiphanes norvegica]
KSSCLESEEELRQKRYIKGTKTKNKPKTSIIASDEEREGEPQLVFTKNKNSMLGDESEEDIEVEQSKNHTKMIKMPRKSIIVSHNKDEEKDNQTFVRKIKQPKSKINVDKQLSIKLKDIPKQSKCKVKKTTKENSNNHWQIEELILPDSNEISDIVKSEVFLKEELNEFDTVQEHKSMDDVLWAIDKVFDLLEKSTEGLWTKTPNEIENDLYDVLQSLKLERFENSSYPNIYNLDVNYRQLYIHFSGVDGMILQHALLCKQRYPNCRYIPDDHQEDMSCCV